MIIKGAKQEKSESSYRSLSDAGKRKMMTGRNMTDGY